jgi:hypothetical protein
LVRKTISDRAFCIPVLPQAVGARAVSTGWQSQSPANREHSGNRTRGRNMNNKLATSPLTPTGDVIESVIMGGDLSKLTPEQRVSYYMKTCESLGLNPYTRPFEYLMLNGKLVLYARRDATDQLRKLHHISVEIVQQTVSLGMLNVRVRATDKDGRTDEDVGIVELPDSLKGTLRANTMMRAITKAKRRVTLSISGLGFSDESEVDDINRKRTPPKPAPNVLMHTPGSANAPDDADNRFYRQPEHVDPDTGEIIDSATGVTPDSVVDAAPSSVDDTPERGDGAVLSLEDMAREAATRGASVLAAFYKGRTPAERAKLNAMGDELRGLADEADKK